MAGQGRTCAKHTTAEAGGSRSEICDTLCIVRLLDIPRIGNQSRSATAPASAVHCSPGDTMSEDISSIDVIMLATPEVESYAWLAKGSWQSYCAQHGYRFTVFDRSLISDLHINWSKIEAVRRTLATSDRSYVLLVDADLVVLRPELPLSHLADNTKDIVFGSDNLLPRPWPDLRNIAVKLRLRMGSLPNAGFMLARRNDFTRAFFTKWLELARGEMSDWADRHPRNQNVLWRGLVAAHRDHIGILDGRILRATYPSDIPKIARRNPFAMHFKHEWVDVNDVQPLVASRG